MEYRQPSHFYSTTGRTGVKLCSPHSECASCSKPIQQTGGGASDYSGLFHAVQFNPRELSIITERYIDQSPMFNPLRRNTVIPTIYDGIVPTGAYLMSQLPATPSYPKFSGDLSTSDVHCLCQRNGIKIYDEVGDKLVPRSRSTLLQKLQCRSYVEEENKSLREENELLRNANKSLLNGHLKSQIRKMEINSHGELLPYNKNIDYLEADIQSEREVEVSSGFVTWKLSGTRLDIPKLQLNLPIDGNEKN